MKPFRSRRVKSDAEAGAVTASLTTTCTESFGVVRDAGVNAVPSAASMKSRSMRQQALLGRRLFVRAVAPLSRSKDECCSSPGSSSSRVSLPRVGLGNVTPHVTADKVTRCSRFLGERCWVAERKRFLQ